MNDAPRNPADTPSFLERQFAFAAHIRNPARNPRPEDVEERRMAIYRDLFFNNVEGFLSSTFPVLRELMPDDHWIAMARDFYDRHRCHTPLFLEIPREFLQYLEQEREPAPGDPPFLRELAHYEWVELALSVAEDPEPADNAGAAPDLLEDPLAVSPLAWAFRYHFPVHRIGPDFVPSEADGQPVFLLIHRDPDDEVHFLELNTVSARLFDLLRDEQATTGRSALERIAEELGHPQPAVVIDGGLRILEQWRDKGIITGR